MQCQQGGCEEEAFAIAHWQGKDTRQCEMHCDILSKFSLVMFGVKLKFTILKTNQTSEVISA